MCATDMRKGIRPHLNLTSFDTLCSVVGQLSMARRGTSQPTDLFKILPFMSVSMWPTPFQVHGISCFASSAATYP